VNTADKIARAAAEQLLPLIAATATDARIVVKDKLKYVVWDLSSAPGYGSSFRFCMTCRNVVFVPFRSGLIRAHVDHCQFRWPRSNTMASPQGDRRKLELTMRDDEALPLVPLVHMVTMADRGVMEVPPGFHSYFGKTDILCNYVWTRAAHLWSGRATSKECSR